MEIKIILIIVILLASSIFVSCAYLSEPVITEGRFPFTFIYKIDNEIITIEDAIIATYAGRTNIGLPSIFPKTRTWNTFYESGRHNIPHLLEISAGDCPVRKGVKIQYAMVMLRSGEAAYYMGDRRGLHYRRPEIVYLEGFKSYGGYELILTPEMLKKYFDIEVIEMTFSSPIKNSFRIKYRRGDVILR